MSVRRAQEEISSREFAEWLAYNRLEPWGQERADLRAAIIAATVANCNRGSDTRPFAAKDFMPDFSRPEGPDDADLEARVRGRLMTIKAMLARKAPK